MKFENKERLSIGPQPSGDDEFTARMRLHQSWYRTNVLKVPYGTGPTPNSKKQYGNMLTEEDAARGCNFLSERLYKLARERIEQATGVVEEFRLLRNMLSSQPMCFNLFGLMVDDLNTATSFWKKILPEEVDRVTRVDFELAPEPIEEYLADHTAFDAFVEYRDTSGSLCFIGIETKLTEPFSPKVYDRPEYMRWMEGDKSAWKPEARDEVTAIKHNQLWRDHLLAFAMLQHPDSEYAKGRLMLVRHHEDGKCAEVVKGYEALLRESDDTFMDMPLDKLMSFFDEIELNDEWRQWLEAFRLRYLL